MATSSKTSTAKSTKSTGTKSSTAKTTSSKSSSKSVKPGTNATSDLKLFVKDSKGKTLGEISVPAGHRVPPTAKKKAVSYETKK